MEKIAVASALLPFTSVTLATSVYLPSSNAPSLSTSFSGSVYANLLPSSASAETTSPSSVRISESISATPEYSP